MTREFNDVSEAYALLKTLGATDRLIQHVILVGEAVERLIDKFNELHIPVDATFIRLGIAFHDAGKILHSEELNLPGKRHELAGEAMLLAQGIEPRLARCCVTHGQWRVMDCTLEELLIALADTLWKGKRDDILENKVLEAVLKRTTYKRWELYVELDSCFEMIAAGGAERLNRSRGK